VTTNDLPPDHTLIIEAHITSSNSKKSQQKVDKHLRNRIITSCGDADVMVGTKHIDPALCIYIGAHLICIDNKHLNSKTPRGNGTLCRVLGVKLKKNASTYKWKNYYGKKVWTVNAKDVEHIQCEHVNKPGYIVQLEAQIQELEKIHDKNPNYDKLEELKKRLSKERESRKFNLEPENFSPEVNVKHFHTSFKKEKIGCKMNQIPANSNDGTTGHKLQGMSKDVIIV
jgi:DNA repair ATPase RecN